MLPLAEVVLVEGEEAVPVELDLEAEAVPLLLADPEAADPVETA